MGLLDNFQTVEKKGEGSYLRQQFPSVYGALAGLLGTAPDDIQGSVMDGNTAAARSAAESTYLPGLLASALPAGKLSALPMLLGATKAHGFSRVPGMLDEMLATYQTTGQVPKLKRTPAIVLSNEETAAFNAARPEMAPKLTSPVLDYRGNHHFNSRGPTDFGNGYPNSEILAQLDNVSSQNLGLSSDRTGIALQALTPRTNAAGQSIRDKLIVNVDQNGRGEAFSIIPSGDGLQKGQKAHAAPFGSGEQSQPEVEIPNGAGAEPLLGSINELINRFKSTKKRNAK